MRLGWLALSVVVTMGCAGEDETSPALTEPADPVCAELEIALPDGSCIRPGIPADGCAAGFVHDGEYGCLPVLPSEPCPPGSMAVPGETECRPVMSCGRGKWGDIAVDDATQFVDGGYVGSDSDGSAQKPWTTVGAALAAVDPGGLVAIAEGTYVEDVVITDISVRLWGVCPEKVTIVGSGAALGAVAILDWFADSTEVHGVGVRGGIFVSGAEHVRVEEVWVHDDVERGIEINDSAGHAEATIRGVLLEGNGDAGVAMGGSQLTMESSVVRGTLPAANGEGGVGIAVNTLCNGSVCDPATAGSAVVRGSLIEENHEVGVLGLGSEASLEGIVVRGTAPRAVDGTWGYGIAIRPCIAELCNPATSSQAAVSGAYVEGNHGAGVMVEGSTATLDAIVVRDTRSRPSDQTGGDGVVIQRWCEGDDCGATLPGSATLSRSLIDANRSTGVWVPGAEAVIEGIVVRNTQPSSVDGLYGQGIAVSLACILGICKPALRSNGTVRGSLLANNREMSLSVAGSEVTIDASVVRDTVAASDGLFGDGVAVLSYAAPASATLTRVAIERSARAGLANFGASVSLGMVAIDCAPVLLAGERYQDSDFHFEDLGENHCGCSGQSEPCKSASAGLAGC